MLTRGELEKYRISPDGRRGTDGAFLQGFRRMLRDVRSLSGFDADEGRVLVRYFYGADGGCEMYLTKLQEKRADCEAVRELNGSYLYRAGRPGGSGVTAIYRFPALSDLAAGCSVLLKEGYHGMAEAYADRRPGGAVYLVLGEERPSLSEFNGRLIPSKSFFFIKEHFRRFSDDALFTVGDLF